MTAGAMEGPTPSRPQIAEFALADNRQQLADYGQQPAHESMDSEDGEYEDNDGESKVSEEEENGEDDENDKDDENVVELGADDKDLSADSGAQRPVRHEFLSSQPSIITITP